MSSFLQIMRAALPALVLTTASPLSQALAAETITIAESPAGAALPLGETPVTVTLALLPQAAARLRAAPQGEPVYLMVEGVHADAAVEATYEVYLGLPAGAAPRRDDPHYVGDFNFFDAEARPRNVSFNITRLFARLRAAGALTDTPTVTIVPNGRPAPAARAGIGRLAIVAIGR
jgi:hypothetical protein